MTDRICIPLKEYPQRIAKAAKLIAQADLDMFIANSNEADFANCRYFSGYWPLFETGAAAITPSGKAALLVGPESGTYARDRSTIPNIHLMVEYRESADPDYPDIEVSSFGDVFESIAVKEPKRIGVAGYLVTTMPMWEGLRAAAPDAEIINADSLMTSLRQIKSEAEIACLREGLRIAQVALGEILGRIAPGMTELEAAGIIEQALYANGAEYESHPVYVLSAGSTAHAISRPTHRLMQAGDMVQLNLGGRVDGYSPSVGRPICLGKMTPRRRELVEFGREAHYKTYEWIRAGVQAAQVAQKFIDLFRDRGYADAYLYGPCHGLGMIEVEKPWMETTSKYPLAENMTFQADTFACDGDFGLRWENGLLVTADGAQMMSDANMEIIEL
ncbi:MAG: aminopeptidase P family protein, partial [Phycisphaerae bacterium]|nr:aminopeptidase P family protein [Phycisphaerae bacterium]